MRTITVRARSFAIPSRYLMIPSSTEHRDTYAASVTAELLAENNDMVDISFAYFLQEHNLA